MKWIKDGISFEEARISSIVIAFFVTIGFAMYQVVVVGDVQDNLLLLLGYELGAIAGVRIAEEISNRGKKSKNKDISQDDKRILP